MQKFVNKLYLSGKGNRKQAYVNMIKVEIFKDSRNSLQIQTAETARQPSETAFRDTIQRELTNPLTCMPSYLDNFQKKSRSNQERKGMFKHQNCLSSNNVSRLTCNHQLLLSRIQSMNKFSQDSLQNDEDCNCLHTCGTAFLNNHFQFEN